MFGCLLYYLLLLHIMKEYEHKLRLLLLYIFGIVYKYLLACVKNRDGPTRFRIPKWVNNFWADFRTGQNLKRVIIYSIWVELISQWSINRFFKSLLFDNVLLTLWMRRSCSERSIAMERSVWVYMQVSRRVFACYMTENDTYCTNWYCQRTTL